MYTQEMRDGNEPINHNGYILPSGEYTDHWVCNCGEGYSYKDHIICARCELSRNITIYVTGDSFQIVEFLDKSIWNYNSGAEITFKEDKYKLEKILKMKINNCRFFDMISSKVGDIYGRRNTQQYQRSLGKAEKS